MVLEFHHGSIDAHLRIGIAALDVEALLLQPHLLAPVSALQLYLFPLEALAFFEEPCKFRSVCRRSVYRQRDFDAFVMSAKGETSTESFQGWAGGEQVTLAIVFTDVVGSTAETERMPA